MVLGTNDLSSDVPAAVPSVIHTPAAPAALTAKKNASPVEVDATEPAMAPGLPLANAGKVAGSKGATS
jgi:hypothetical protein